MTFAEQPPSKQWAVLKYRGEKFAEVWFKPEGEPCALVFRIPEKSFRTPGLGQQLTMQNLLKIVAIAPEEIESWRHGDVSAGTDGAHPELAIPLPPPLQDVTHLDVHVRLKPPPQAVAPSDSTDGRQGESGDREVSLKKWQDLDARWKAILSLEANMDTLRMSMEGLQAELESSLKKTLTTEEKQHARRADLAQWGKAKGRVQHALPKVREAIHRCVWALGAPERKQLEELYKNHIQPQIPFPQMDRVLEQLENLQKDRQVLAAHGTTIYHESKNISSEVQNTLRTLQSNAAANAQKKKSASGAKGKFFKSVRKWSGAE